MTRELVMAITRIEALHLSQMTEQFRDLLDATTDASSDDDVARLVPEGYLDDDAAAREFRRLTERELLDVGMQGVNHNVKTEAHVPLAPVGSYRQAQ